MEAAATREAKGNTFSGVLEGRRRERVGALVGTRGGIKGVGKPALQQVAFTSIRIPPTTVTTLAKQAPITGNQASNAMQLSTHSKHTTAKGLLVLR